MTKFMSLEFLGLSQTTGKIKNAVYGLEISALVPEKLKFEKYVKYAKLFKFLFLKYLIDFESLFWMKQIQGSVRFMHGWSFFSFHFLSFSISFPKLTIFTILRLYMACKMWKITALT